MNIATEDNPMRASSLPKLLECPASVLLESLRVEREAADTGSLVHAAVDAFHKGKDGEQALEEARLKFPKGDSKKALKHFIAYRADEKNRDAEVTESEQRVVCRIPDPFGGDPVVFAGTLDQVRKADGRETVADIKTGETFYGESAIRYYAAQQSCYVVGARQTFGREIHPGSLICTYGYFKREGKAHWNYADYGWDYAACYKQMEYAAGVISLARKGIVGVNPGDSQCAFCPHKGTINCLPKLKDVSNV